MKKWGFTGLVICSTLFSQAQSIYGIVRDLASGKALSNVIISKTDDAIALLAITDSSGYFSIKAQSSAPASYTFQLPGYLSSVYPLQPSNNPWRITLMPETYYLDAAQVKGMRAENNAPTTFVNLSKKDIKEQDFSKDFPYLLQMTPSVVVFSDAGTGIGYTGMRIRGVDQTRINVTINGVPVNDAESQGVFWVDLPDIASSVESVQIQRGIGTSANGPSAFGGSINVKTDHLPKEAFSLINLGYGSFNTYRGTVQMGTGELSNGWNMSGRMSLIQSDGFIDRSTSDLNSWYLSSSKKLKKGQLKINVFSGHERTYQAWNGVPQPKFMHDSVELDRYIQQLDLSEFDSTHLSNSKPDRYNEFTYKNQVDDYRQTYYQLFYQHRFRPNILLNAGLYYTRGEGYYEEFKKDESFADYGLTPIQLDTTEINQTNLVRRRWLDNHLMGALYNLHYQTGNWNFTAGGSAQRYTGHHFGEVIWANFASDALPDHEFYRNRAIKDEWSQYVKVDYQYQKWRWFGDVQLRGVHYQFVGPDRNLIQTNREVFLLFFNPKAGLTYDISKRENAYLSAGLANREPVRADFINSGPESAPKPERMFNIEGGYRYMNSELQINLNGFLMYYQDQLVLTGKVNDVGAYTRTNIAESYRTGVESSFGFRITDHLIWSGNLAWSLNKIPEFTEYVDDWTNWGQQVRIDHKNTDLAFSPEWVGSSDVSWMPAKGVNLHWTVPFMSRQYLDNTSSMDRSLDPVLVNNLSVQWEIPKKKLNTQIKKLTLSAAVNNVENGSYAPNGYTFSAVIKGKREHFNYVYPQAGRHFMIKIVAEF
jgi:iron complex outermembrane receptor protein